MIRSSLRVVITVSAVLALLGGCASKPKTDWQTTLWDDGFIPLPNLAVMRVIERDPANPQAAKLVTKDALVGSYREAHADDFRREQVPWMWREIPQLTQTDLPTRLVGGAEKYVDKIGLKFNVQALLRTADVTVDVGPSKSLELSKMWFLEAPALKRENFHLVLRPLITELTPDPARKSFFLLTKVLGGDIDEQKNLTIKVDGKVKGERFPVKVELGGGQSWEFKGHGVALGVQGQIVTRVVRGTMRPSSGKWTPISRGQKTYEIEKDLVVITRDPQNRLTVGWVGVPDVETYARAGTGAFERVQGTIPVDASFVLIGDLKLEGGRLLVLQLGWDGGTPVILSGATYDLSFRNLDADSLRAFFTTQARADREAWAKAIGNDALLNDVMTAHENILRIQPEADRARIARYEIVEAFASVAGSSSQYDHVRMTRYDVRGLGGKNFKLDVYREGAVGIVRSRLWVQRANERMEDITPAPGSFTGTSHTIVIPHGVDYMYLRAGLRHDKKALNATGFHSGRYVPVRELSWQAAFVSPRETKCRLVLGERTPDAPLVPDRARGALPAWAARLLAMPTDLADAEVRTVQDASKGDFDICRFSVKEIGHKVGWLIHDAP